MATPIIRWWISWAAFSGAKLRMVELIWVWHRKRCFLSKQNCYSSPMSQRHDFLKKNKLCNSFYGRLNPIYFPCRQLFGVGCHLYETILWMLGFRSWADINFLWWNKRLCFMIIPLVSKLVSFNNTVFSNSSSSFWCPNIPLLLIFKKSLQWHNAKKHKYFLLSTLKIK